MFVYSYSYRFEMSARWGLAFISSCIAFLSRLSYKVHYTPASIMKVNSIGDEMGERSRSGSKLKPVHSNGSKGFDPVVSPSNISDTVVMKDSASLRVPTRPTLRRTFNQSVGVHDHYGCSHSTDDHQPAAFNHLPHPSLISRTLTHAYQIWLSLYPSLPLTVQQIMAHIISAITLSILVVYAYSMEYGRHWKAVARGGGQVMVGAVRRQLPTMGNSEDVHFAMRAVYFGISKAEEHYLPNDGVVEDSDLQEEQSVATSLPDPAHPSGMALSDYCEYYGYTCEDEVVETLDGFKLLVHHVTAGSRVPAPTSTSPRSSAPVLLMHGLFQSGGVFVTSGPSSPAFWLVDQG
jgi:hypothetical protein